jgi:hypothetical protein
MGYNLGFFSQTHLVTLFEGPSSCTFRDGDTRWTCSLCKHFVSASSGNAFNFFPAYHQSRVTRWAWEKIAQNVPKPFFAKVNAQP